MPDEPLIPPDVGIFDNPVIKLSINPEWWAHISGKIATLTYRDEWDGTDDQKDEATQQIYKLLNIPHPIYPATLWGEDVPEALDSEDGGAVEIGVRFHAETPGKILGIRFYKAEANTGEHHGYLYSTTGDLLGTLVFVGETASGWQSGLFDVPIAIQACVVYTASYHAPNGHYSRTTAQLTDGYANPPLYAEPSESYPHGNGVYKYGDGGNFPDGTYLDTNYWADVIFSPD